MTQTVFVVTSWHWALAFLGLVAGAVGGFLMARRLPTPSLPGIVAEMLAVGVFVYLLAFQNLPSVPAGLPILGSFVGSLVGVVLRFRELKR